MTINKIAPELTQRAKLDDLLPMVGNPRRGALDTIREILLGIGQVEPLVINIGTHTGRVNEILGGNNRYKVMRAEKWTEAGVTYVDVDHVTARKIAAGLNKAGDDATYDQRALADFLAAIAAESDLSATGYTDQGYDALVRETDLFGNAAAGALGDYLDPPIDDGAPPRKRPIEDVPLPGSEGGQEPAYVTVSWTVLPEEREIIRTAIKDALSRWQTGTGSAALVALCDDYNRNRTA